MSALASVLAQAQERERHRIPIVADEDAPLVVYFSSVTRNTDRFIAKLPVRSVRLPLGAGNTNFGPLFCVAAEKVAAKCQVPLLYKFELMGTDEDVEKVTQGLEEFWQAFTQPRE